MAFTLPTYHAPDFTRPEFTAAPNAALAPAPRDGVAPQNYHSTSMYPEYFKVDGRWLLAEESRMDCTAVLREGRVEIVEFRNLRAGDAVFLGRSEDGREGIYLWTEGFAGAEDGAQDSFAFRQGRSRETGYTRDYNQLAELLRYEREHGSILWVMGPACSFDAGARRAFAALVRSGYVNGLMAGNALATHDMEASYLGTALGSDLYTQQPRENGHYNHLDTINRVRECGSILAFIETGAVTDGIIYECVQNKIPFVLAGSIRDDGPLPEVVGNVYEAQNRMRALVRGATTIICMATTLHTIATGNMTPSYRVVDGKIRPLYFYSIDISEFAVGKLQDRGSLSVRTIVTNVQDFITKLAADLGAE